MKKRGRAGPGFIVALPTEGVDRNSKMSKWIMLLLVALPTEGVDRNSGGLPAAPAARVALPTEGVDRNPFCFTVHARKAGRPPHGGRG